MKVHYILDCSFDGELYQFLRALLKQGIVLRVYVSPHIDNDGTEHVHLVVVYPRRSSRSINWIGYHVTFGSVYCIHSIKDYLSFSHGRKQPFFAIS